MKIIFLDIDGVLNSETDFVEAGMYGHEPNATKYTLKSGREVLLPISSGKLALLEMIIAATDAKIVITSTWREEFKLGDIHEKFRVRGFRLPRTCIIGKTKDSIRRMSSDHTYTRSSEISDWLSEKDDIESYVILDDISPTMFHGHDDHLITTSEYDGLNKLQATQAINILGRNENAQELYDEHMKHLDMLINCMV